MNESVESEKTPPEIIQLPSKGGAPERVHVFDRWEKRSRVAAEAAIGARRPLLVLGEPGVGKTQLAMAMAACLKRPFVSYTVDSQTESRDLLWRLDSVKRLAEAQICGVPGMEGSELAVDERLAVGRFLEPGPLWWGFDWASAESHCQEHKLAIPEVPDGAEASNGRVVLIDEIDKADSDVPNGLLEALGSGRFTPRECSEVVMTEPSPLVVITSNGERALPEAFLRRCLILRLTLPDGEELKEMLIERGRAHFPHVDTQILTQAAVLLVKDRAGAVSPRPGQAEFLDLVRAVTEMESDFPAALELLKDVAEFTVKKHGS